MFWRISSTSRFESDAFDAVVSIHAIHHLPLEEHKTAYLEFHRVLRPGGRGRHSQRLVPTAARANDRSPDPVGENIRGTRAKAQERLGDRRHTGKGRLCRR